MRQSITQKQTIVPQTAAPVTTDGVDLTASGAILRVKKLLVTVTVTGGTAAVYEVWGRTDAKGSATWGRIGKLNGGVALASGDAVHEVIDNAGAYDRLALRYTGGTPISTAVVCELLENGLRGD